MEINTPSSADDAIPVAESDPYEFIRTIDGRLNYETPVVLVIDDEASMRSLITREIHHVAPDVLTMEAGHGKQGLLKLRDIRESFKCDPVLIVLDLKMPVMDGWEFIHELKNEYLAEGKDQGIPLIVMSSTRGERRVGLHRDSIHGGHSDYVPLVSVAKDACVDPSGFDAMGKHGLVAWLKHFLKAG